MRERTSPSARRHLWPFCSFLSFTKLPFVLQSSQVSHACARVLQGRLGKNAVQHPVPQIQEGGQHCSAECSESHSPERQNSKKNEATQLGWCNVQCALPPSCCKMRTHEEVVRAPPPGSLKTLKALPRQLKLRTSEKLPARWGHLRHREVAQLLHRAHGVAATATPWLVGKLQVQELPVSCSRKH